MWSLGTRGVILCLGDGISPLQSKDLVEVKGLSVAGCFADLQVEHLYLLWVFIIRAALRVFSLCKKEIDRDS